MRRSPIPRVAIAFLLVIVTGVASAATRYVSDQLSVNLRRGPGTGYNIKKLIDAGDKLTTLSKSDGWTKIRTASGTTGYVLTRQLSDKPAAATRLDKYRQQNKKLRKQNKSLSTNAGSAKKKIAKLQKQNKQLTSQKKTISQKLEKLRETSADAVRINKQNKKYHKKVMSLESTVERLKHENEALESRREGMKIGALILFVGIVVGLLLSLMRRRRSGSWSDSL
ncbi:TIGR04211 family SH3 domain-containing protein [Salinisphaera orenii]|uniref:TIGR04211 family SH3 domain-containing protein n=1 Tax=Salinisphaera orenii TaxID=856731 RepID=UPI000DBE5746